MERIKNWRPRKLDDIFGKRNFGTVERLREIIRTRRSTAMLLLGPFGSGKTTAARIIKAGFNCLRPDPSTGEACWSCMNCERCKPENNGEYFTYQTWELDGTGKLDRETLVTITEEAREGYCPPFIFVDEFARVDEATAQPVLLRFTEDLRDGVFIAAAMADDDYKHKRHKIHPALFDRLEKRWFFKPEFDEIVEFFLQRLPDWKINAIEKDVRQLVRVSGQRIRECLRLIDQAYLDNGGRLDREFLDRNAPDIEEHDHGSNPFGEDTD